jgi:hypothetical protein
MHLLALKRPTGHLRDLRFLLCSSAAGIVQGPFDDPNTVTVLRMREPRRALPVRRDVYVRSEPQPLDEYHLLMAAHRTSSIASKPRRASRAKGSRKPSAPRAPRLKS